MEKLKANLSGIIKYLNRLHSYDYEVNKNSSSFSGTIGRYDVERGMFAINSYFEQGEYMLAILELWYQNQILLPVKEINSEGLANDEYFSNTILYLKWLQRFWRLYNEFNEKYFQPYLKEIESKPIFQSGDLGGMDPYIILFARKGLDEGLIKLFQLQKGRGVDWDNVPDVTMYQSIVVTRGIADVLSAVKRLSLPANEFHFLLVAVLDDEPAYSYFVLLFVYQGNIWLGTDQINFHNPLNKASSRNPGRHRERHWEGTLLPYDLMDSLIEGKNQKGLVLKDIKTSNTFGAYWKDIKPEERLYLFFLVSHIVKKLSEGEPLKEITTAKEYKETVMLPAAPGELDFQPLDDEGFRDQDEFIREHVHHLVTSLDDGEEVSTALAKTSSDLALSYDEFDDNWLAPPDKVANYTRWLVLRKQAEGYRAKLEEMKERIPEDKIRISEHLTANAESVIKRIYMAREIRFVYSMDRKQVSGFGNVNRPHSVNFIQDYFKDRHISRIFSDIPIFVPIQKHWEDHNCQFCGKYKAKRLRMVEIKHYMQLVWLMGLNSWRDLPPSFRRYKYHGYEPYMGNSILDNTHPYTLLRDSKSQESPNGFGIIACMCKLCHNKFAKAYQKDVMFIDTEGNEIENFTGDNDRKESIAIEFNRFKL